MSNSMYLMNWIWSHFTTISTFIVTLQRTTWNSIGNSCNVYDKTHGTSKVGECKNVTTELIFVIPLVLSLKILSGRNFYVFRVAFMRTFRKVLFLQPAYLFSTQNATVHLKFIQSWSNCRKRWEETQFFFFLPQELAKWFHGRVSGAEAVEDDIYL